MITKRMQPSKPFERLEEQVIVVDIAMSADELKCWESNGWKCERVGKTYFFTRAKAGK